MPGPLMQQRPLTQAEEEQTIGDDMPGAEPATAEEQQAFQQVEIAGNKAIWENEETQNAILGMLKNTQEDIGVGIGEAAVMIITQLDQQAGGQIPETVILPAAGAFVEQIAELANAQPDLPEVNQDVIDRATIVMERGLAEEYGADPEDAEQMMSQMTPDQLEQVRKRYEGQ